MNHLSKLRTCSILKWDFVNLAEFNLTPSKTTIGGACLNHITQNPRFYRRKASVQSINGQKSNVLPNEDDGSSIALREAQDALIEYLHSTRSLQYLDAENIGRNSPKFLENLLKGVENEKDAKQSIRRLLRYHPINEFEPFFESMGLKLCEYSSILPRNIMYLSDDQLLLANYHVLCEYGIAPNKMGKIFLEAREVFRYDHGRLLSQLDSLQEMGFSQSGVAKIVASSPNLLVNRDFSKVLDQLTDVGIVESWFDVHISEENSYDWSKILETLSLLKKFGIRNQDLGELLRKNAAVLMEDSGARTISLIVFLIKFGASVDDILSMFKQFPEFGIQRFMSNLKNGYHFLLAIEMDINDISNIIRTHPTVLGSCILKTVKTLLNGLNSGKKRLCDIIKENPLEMKNWVLGTKVKALPNSKKDFPQKKIRFLLDLGFTENSSEMSKALKSFRGHGGELQERFDCLVNAGLRREDVAVMVKSAPQVINQTKEVLETKIDFLVNDLRYPVASLVAYPAFLSCSFQKIKLRFAMCNWLVDCGKMKGKLALSTVLASSDRNFLRDKVDRHPERMEVWNKFKNQFYPE
ncbi:transcription termination factor MTEF18, mitochondrial-like [Cynara cardunculus var. scolymus]|uniref:Mitochodrial transcription termination factor-related protein n=1 Tax=Cynara cardunculus var. scolymus TaxID=59895 RepID=A0A103Y6N0_CYNCS|nr:transcription termination factor MTEF18, mitochondrial-like [Cynara cardunculus var. scolymus]KVI03521.1 Mitochodrial transcription termination factor-related protein [Cynara cardunculus var. scolymus]